MKSSNHAAAYLSGLALIGIALSGCEPAKAPQTSPPATTPTAVAAPVNGKSAQGSWSGNTYTINFDNGWKPNRGEVISATAHSAPNSFMLPAQDKSLTVDINLPDLSKASSITGSMYLRVPKLDNGFVLARLRIYDANMKQLDIFPVAKEINSADPAWNEYSYTVKKLHIPADTVRAAFYVVWGAKTGQPSGVIDIDDMTLTINE